MNDELKTRIAELKTRIAELQADLKELMGELTERIDTKVASKDLNWGHAGDLGFYRERLRDVLGYNG